MICPILLEYEGGALLRRTEVLQGVRKMRFEKAYRGWQKGRFKVDTSLLKSVGHGSKPDDRITHVEQDPAGIHVESWNAPELQCSWINLHSG